MKKKWIYKLIVLILISLSIIAADWTNVGTDQGFISKTIKCILPIDNNKVWFGTIDGLVLYDITSDTIIEFYNKSTGLSDNFITSLIKVDEDLWVGTYNGINIIKPDKSIETIDQNKGLTENNVTSMIRVKNEIWVGTKNWGINIYNINLDKWHVLTIADGLAGNNINDICYYNNRVIIATADGISIYNANLDIFNNYSELSGLSSNRVKTVFANSYSIWCGTEGDGISLLNPVTEEWRTINEADGLSDGFIFTMVGDGNYLWIGTFYGVTVYNPLENTYTTYSKETGLPDNSIGAISILDNYVIVGTDNNGFAYTKKPYPSGEFELSYEKVSENIIEIIAIQPLHEKINYNIEYAAEGMSGQWNNRGIEKVIPPDDNLIGRWNIKEINDGNYILRINLQKEDVTNSYYLPLYVDKIIPTLILDDIPRYSNSKQFTIRGRYNEDNLSYIKLFPYDVFAEISMMFQSFESKLKLELGENRIGIVIADRMENTSQDTIQIICDLDKPHVEVLNEREFTDKEIELQLKVYDSYPQKIIISPGYMNFPLKQSGELVKIPYQLTEQDQYVEISVFDKAGNITTIKDTYSYRTQKIQGIELESYPEITNRSVISIIGKVYVDKIHSFSISPPSGRLDFDTYTKLFTYSWNLEPGRNMVVLNLLDGNKKLYTKIITIKRDDEPPTLIPNKYPRIVREKEISITTKYIEKNYGDIKISPSTVKYQVDTSANEITLLIQDLQSGNNEISLELSDAAGNNTVQTFNIVYEPDYLLSYIVSDTATQYQKYNLELYTNFELNSFSLVPSPASIEYDTQIHYLSGEYLLQEGYNTIYISLLNDKQEEYTKTFTVLFDVDTPQLRIKKDISETSKNEISLDFVFEENHPQFLHLLPYDRYIKLPDNTASWSDTVELIPGNNIISALLIDMAGRVAADTIVINYKPRFDIESYITKLGDTEIINLIKKLQDEKKELKSRIVKLEKQLANVPAQNQIVISKGEISEQSAPAVVDWRELYGISRNLYRIEKYTKALKKLLLAISAKPNHVSSYNLAGMCYIKESNFLNASMFFAGITAITDNIPGYMWNNLGISLERINLFSLAEKSYKKAINTAKGSYPKAEQNLAALLNRQKVFMDRYGKPFRYAETYDTILLARLYKGVKTLDEFAKISRNYIQKTFLPEQLALFYEDTRRVMTVNRMEQGIEHEITTKQEHQQITTMKETTVQKTESEPVQVSESSINKYIQRGKLFIRSIYQKIQNILQVIFNIFQKYYIAILKIGIVIVLAITAYKLIKRKVIYMQEQKSKTEIKDIAVPVKDEQQPDETQPGKKELKKSFIEQLKEGRVSLKIQFSALVGVLIIIVISVVSYFILQEEIKSLEKEILARGKVLTEQFALSCQEAILNDDILTLGTIAAKIKEQESVVYGTSIGLNGKIYSHTNRSEEGKTLSGKDLEEIKSIKETTVTSREYQGEKIFDIAWPMIAYGKKIGIVKIGMSKEIINASIRAARRQIIFISVFVLIGSVIATIILVTVVVKPIGVLAKGADIIGTGNLDYKIDVKSRNEIGDLAYTFNKMTDDLKVAQQAMVAKELMERDMKIAQQIQQTLLPDKCPMVEGFSFGAFYQSTKTVGGDYYDFVEVNEDKIGVVVADVSGKGVPGAFVMAVTRMALRSQVPDNPSAADVLRRTNAITKKDTKRGMFVTIFYGILDMKKLTFNFAIAGHEPLMIFNSDTKELKSYLTKGKPVSMFKPKRFDSKLEEKEIQLKQGELVIQYTDGVTEAMNKEHEQFGMERLEENIKKYGHLAAQEFVDKIIEEVQTFVAGYEQSDDINMVAFRVEK